MLAHDFLKKDDRGFRPTSSSRSAWYFTLLIAVKLLRCFGIFIVDVLAKQIHIVTLLWLLKIVASAILIPVQKPLSHGKSLKRTLLMRIIQLTFFNCFIEILWFYGITFCGPFRSILVFEQSPAVILVAIMTVLKGSSTPSKTRGLIALSIGYVALIVMDRDTTVESDHLKSHSHQSVLNHLFYHAIHWSGVSDHKSGVLLLIFALFMKMAYDSCFRRLAVEIGGPKRLYSIILFFSAIVLTPLAVLAITNGSHIESYTQFCLLLLASGIIIMVFDFYAESICFQHVADPVMAAARWSPMIMFACAFGLAWMWYTPSLHQSGNHALSGGVFLTLICFTIASYALTSSNTPRIRAGHYVGLSETGLPLYTYGEAFLQKTSRSIMLFVKETLAEVLCNSDSRRIFWFLCANLMFCGVEFLYGFWTNSLGLISDGFHMLFDCSALVMGLIASVMSRWPASKYYSYGYGRVEVLSGFINALFLVVIAFFIFLEALERLYDPPDIHTEKLMFVAVCGLIINIFGMFAFHGGHAHTHAGGNSHSHISGYESCHGHSHNSNSHGHNRHHSHSGHHGHSDSGHSHLHNSGPYEHRGENANMRGVFLHVLADTLGSVFVIISTILMQSFGWKWVDPFCSLILSMLILTSVIPLLKASMATLMQNIPPELEEDFDHTLNNILHIDGVISFSRSHLWQLKSDVNIVSIHLQTTSDTNDQIIRHKVQKLLKAIGITQICIQIEKDYFLQQIQLICPLYHLPHRVNKGVSLEHMELNQCCDNHNHSCNHHEQVNSSCDKYVRGSSNHEQSRDNIFDNSFSKPITGPIIYSHLHDYH